MELANWRYVPPFRFWTQLNKLWTFGLLLGDVVIQPDNKDDDDDGCRYRLERIWQSSSRTGSEIIGRLKWKGRVSFPQSFD